MEKIAGADQSVKTGIETRERNERQSQVVYKVVSQSEVEVKNNMGRSDDGELQGCLCSRCGSNYGASRQMTPGDCNFLFSSQTKKHCIRNILTSLILPVSPA